MLKNLFLQKGGNVIKSKVPNLSGIDTTKEEDCSKSLKYITEGKKMTKKHQSAKKQIFY